jgi:hypothetical protein
MSLRSLPNARIENLPSLPGIGVWRNARQAGLYLEAELHRAINSPQAETLLQQAQSLSHSDFQRIKALLALLLPYEEPT